ncbi:hypothetical protein B0G38_003922 [Arthrobacter sp. VKM Ac-2550]|jgi:hypothetical protein|nr:hypothetical protein [Arthrobacter sp. VKM Ac-2550]
MEQLRRVDGRCFLNAAATYLPGRPNDAVPWLFVLTKVFPLL